MPPGLSAPLGPADEVPEELSARLRAALPGSPIGHVVRDSLNEAVRVRPSGEQVGSVHLAEDGRPVIVEVEPAVIEHIHAAQDGAAQAAGGLEATPDRPVAADDDLGKVIIDGGISPLSAMASALWVARQHNVPVSATIGLSDNSPVA